MSYGSHLVRVTVTVTVRVRATVRVRVRVRATVRVRVGVPLGWRRRWLALLRRDRADGDVHLRHEVPVPTDLVRVGVKG